MADKRVTIYIVDVGSSTGECHNGRIETDLDYGMRYVWDKISKEMVADKASWQVGVIGLRTDETDNPLSGTEDYENISVLKTIGQMKMGDLAPLRRKIQPSETESGDAISAIVLAIDLITKATTLKSGKLGKYTRKIVLLTNGQGHIEDDGLESIAGQIKETEIQLVVIGVDFDDSDYGFKEEDKPSVKKHTERTLKTLTDSCNGIIGTAAEAIDQLSIPDVKETRPYSTFEAQLSLGDYERYPDSALYIDVKRYFKVHQAKPVSASSFANSRFPVGDSAQLSGTLSADTDMPDASLTGMSAVKTTRNYQVNHHSGVGGKLDVPFEDLAKGYEYGSSVVPMEEGNKITTAFSSSRSFSIIGFIPSDKYERYFNMGESGITIAQPMNDKAKIAFSSFVHALYELDSYAVARIVVKDGKAPQILLLAPSIDLDQEALIDVPLPFAEDVRVYRFPPLDRIVNSSGGIITKHRYLPTDDLDDAMGKYIDKMDLSTFGTDDEGQPCEYMKIEDTYSPIIHRVNQAICQRAVYPDEEVKPPSEILTKWSNPPSKLVAKATSELQTLIDVADVKKVPPKVKGKRGRETAVPLSGLDIESLVTKKSKISRDNAIPEFKQMLRSTTDDSVILNAANQIGTIILNLISESTGDATYEQVISYMRVFREEMFEYEMPDVYNNYIRGLKDKLIKSQLGDRRDFWFDWKTSKLGLIDNQALEVSEVTEEEARQFFVLETTQLPRR